MKDFEIIETDEGEFFTGCKPPVHRSLFAGLATVANNVGTISMDDARRYLDRKTYNSHDLFHTWIRNQGRRGSCNGYAGAKALQRSRFKRRQKLIELSGEGLYCTINDGQDQGSMLIDGMNQIMRGGVPSTKYVPYEEYRKDRVPPEAWEEAKRFRGEELYQITNEADLITALCFDFDCVVAVHAGNSWTKLTNNDMVPPAPGPGNHAVGVDDIRYSEARSRFEYAHFGSWGEGIHIDGYAWLGWEEHLAQTIRNHGFYAIRSTTDDPEDAAPVVS